ncbi:MAG TPA: ATP-binding protein, partial [Polyangiaceae bacterium]
SAYSPKKGHFVAVFDNVTERKKAEVALLATQQQLAQSQKMEAVGRLAGGVAHDFNNLLTVIHGYGEMVRDSLSGDLRHESMEELLKAAGRAASLTRQLLAFSRKQVLEPKIVRLDAIVRETGRMLERLIGEHIALSLALPETLATVKADPGQIEQVVLNLAVNARDAMPGGGRLTISVDSVTEPVPIDGFPEILPAGRWIRLTVEDTGCGMEKETLAHAFEPFFTTKERGRGTGLGLSTVYGIVQQSDGHVQVTSAPGIGTAFRIYLPRSDEKKTSGPRPSVLSRQGTETVLVVEDEPAVRNLVRAVLERKGYVVLVAHDGAAALDLVDKHAGVIHVLLTDVVMPGMNGRDLAALVRTRRPSIKVVLMSGYTADVSTELGTEGGPAFLSKPFTEQALTAKLREALDTPQA